MFLKTNTYELTDDSKLSVTIHHNRAIISILVWDTEAHEWLSAFKTAYEWENASELLELAIDLAEKHAPNLLDNLQELFSHTDFS